MFSNLNVGVLALQGDFVRHLHQLSLLGASCREIRSRSDLPGLDGLIIPGGESTTMNELINRFSLRQDLENFCTRKAVWGTCAGLIMLSREVDNDSVQPLNAMDISVIRNGYGRQVYSFYAEIQADLNGKRVDLKASFIRAPLVAKFGPQVNVLATYRDSPVLLAYKNILVSCFHTELEEDLTLTRYFLENFVPIKRRQMMT